ncbi:hypothetical protein [Streptomyces sp. NPDC051183]|uniref:hypothetical protein n=1 Tax=Streptomyces sp. NPDC051183 TaxID=3155165 RepID=UPI00343B1BB1
MPRTAAQLLTALDPLHHRARLRLTATTARDLAATGELAPVLADLEGRGRYERRLAALGALAGRQAEHLAARLADPDPVVRSYALRAARTLPLPDGAIEAVYADASAEVRWQLAHVIRAGALTALAERLVLRLAEEWGEREAAALLPACSEEFTARTLPRLADSVTDWARLGRRHPGPVLHASSRRTAGTRTACSRPRSPRPSVGVTAGRHSGGSCCGSCGATPSWKYGTPRCRRRRTTSDLTSRRRLHPSRTDHHIAVHDIL